MSDAAEFGHIWFAWPSRDARLTFCALSTPYFA
jgi:hypothetical protein